MTQSETKIAVAKGELGSKIEGWLRGNYGVSIRIEGRPLSYKQSVGSLEFVPMTSKDVPMCVANGLVKYGITGNDLVDNYNLGAGVRILKTLKELDFGKGDLVLFSEKSALQRLASLKQGCKVVAPAYYYNLLVFGEAGDYIRRNFGAFEVIQVEGSTEGFVLNGWADFGYDITTLLRKEAQEEKSRTTLLYNRLTVVENVESRPTQAILLSKDTPECSAEAFETLLNFAKACVPQN